MKNNTTTRAKNKNAAMIAAFVLCVALGATTMTADTALAPDPTNVAFTISYGAYNEMECVKNFVLNVPGDVSPTAYLLGTNQNWLSVADSTGAVSGTIAPGTNKTITVSVFPEGLPLGSYSGKITSGDAWLDVTINVDIVQKELGLDGLVVNNKKYDGNVTATVFSYGTLRGIVGAEEVTLVTTNASAVFRPNANPDTEPKIVYVSGLALAGAQAGNYSINNIRTMAYIMLPSMVGDFDGDRLADPAMMATSGVWKIWLSSAGYAPVTAGPFYVAGSAVLAGDFDGDRLADPVVMTTNGIWVIWLSSVSYLQVATGPFYVAGSTAVTGDFDGDRLADPAAVAANGVWKIWMSSASYAPVTAGPFYVAGSAVLAGDFDGDRLADPVVMTTNGIWVIWMSSVSYLQVATGPFYVAGSTAVTADFDGDRFADPAAVAANGVWKIWLSSASYAQVTTRPFYVSGGVAPVAGDFDGDRLADPAMMATNGVWKIWMSSASYAPLTTSPLIP